MSMHNRSSANPRYPHFKQAFFTAGDREQFFRAISRESGRLAGIKYSPPFPKLNREIPQMYKAAASFSTLIDTFDYLFTSFKKGLFVFIKDNRVADFVPFSNAAYRNTWAGSYVRVARKFRSAESLFRAAADAEALAGGKKFPWRKGCVSEMMETWFANGHLIRSEWPPHEMDSGVHNMKYLFESLCAERRIPDCAFFVNRRDFPLLRVDGTEPYEAIYGVGCPLVNANLRFKKHLPILSGCTAAGFADIPIPTWDDMARVLYQEKRCFFPKSGSDYRDPFVPWAEKTKDVAVFRGASTGQGVTPDTSSSTTSLSPETNIRLRAAKLCTTDPVFKDTLDAGITSWCTRPRSVPGHVELLYLDAPSVGVGLSKRLSPTQQAAYKYILHLPGHSAAMRLSMELAMGSVLLIPPCKYKLFFFDWLVPGTHYLSVAEDLSDVPRVVRWCRDHDEACARIARNARLFYDKHLSRRGLFDYMQNVLIQLRETCGPLIFSAGDVDARTYAVEHVPRALVPPSSHAAILATPQGGTRDIRAPLGARRSGHLVARRAGSVDDELHIRRACIASAALAGVPGHLATERWLGELDREDKRELDREDKRGSGVYLRESMVHSCARSSGMERTLLDLVSFPSSRRLAPYDPLEDLRASVSVAIEALSLLAQAQESVMFCHNAFGPHAVVLRTSTRHDSCKFHTESGFPRAVLCNLFRSSVDAGAALLALGYDGRPRTPNFTCDVASFMLLFVHAATRKIRIAENTSAHTHLRENDVRFVLEVAFFFLRPLFPRERLRDLVDARRLVATYCPFARTDSEIDVFPRGALSVALGPTDRCLVYDTPPPLGFDPPASFSLRACLADLARSRTIAVVLPCLTFESSPLHLEKGVCRAFDPHGGVLVSPPPTRFPTLRDQKAVRRFLQYNYDENAVCCPSAHLDNKSAKIAKAFVALIGGPDQASLLRKPNAKRLQYDPQKPSILSPPTSTTQCTDKNTPYDPTNPSIFFIKK